MGTDKAALVVDDAVMLARVVDALRSAGADEVVVVGGDPVAAVSVGAHFEADRWPGEGPLGGLVTGLCVLATELAVVAACDLPDIDPAVVHDLASILIQHPHADAVIPVVDGRSQPLLAAYRRRCADTLAAAFESGQRRLEDALDALQSEHPRFAGPSFVDLDTPDDVAARAARLRSGAMDAGVPAVDVVALADALAAGALLIDVREPDEYAEAHVATGRLVPLQSIPSYAGQLPVDQPVYVICRSGGRSHNAAVFLRGQGIDAINVAGGTLAWIAADLPVDTGAGN